MFFKKDTTIDSLLSAVDISSVDNVLGGGNLISDDEVTSEKGKEVIRLLNDRAARLMECVKSETEKLLMVNEIIKSGMWTMYFDPVSGEINRVDWSDEFRRM